jgi:cytidyltransferase-like protein
MNIAYSFGIIDLLHYGHINTLMKARNESDLHIFGLINDEIAIDWMGGLISNYQERFEVLKQINCIDEIMSQESLSPLDNLQAIHDKYPKATITLYHGDNWKIMPAKEYVESIGGKVVFTEYYSKLTPEKIQENLKKSVANESLSKKSFINTKAETLVALKSKLKMSTIEDIYILNIKNYLENPDKSYKEILSKFIETFLVIRSSSTNEDAIDKSNAGHYDSVLNVDVNSKDKVFKAINDVINSFFNVIINPKNWGFYCCD